MPKATEIRYWPYSKGGGYFCNYKRRQHELVLGPKDAPTGSARLYHVAVVFPTRRALADALRRLIVARIQLDHSDRLDRGRQHPGPVTVNRIGSPGNFSFTFWIASGTSVQ